MYAEHYETVWLSSEFIINIIIWSITLDRSLWQTEFRLSERGVPSKNTHVIGAESWPFPK